MEEKAYKGQGPEVETNAEELNDVNNESTDQEGDVSSSDTNHHKKSSKKNKKGKDIENIDELNDKIASLEESLLQKDDQYLRLQAEFDNYRKRTLKEKMELTKSATAGLMINILTVVDDFDRAMQLMGDAVDQQSVKDGFELIYKRFTNFLIQNGISEIEAKEKEFDTDLHDAITKIPAPTEELKGKVVDVIQKGYCMNDKVIRFAKVVIGE